MPVGLDRFKKAFSGKVSEDLYKGRRQKAVDALTAAEGYVKALGVSDVAKDHAKTIAALKKKIEAADKEAKKSREKAYKALEDVKESAREVCERAKADAEKLFKKQKAAVAKTVEKLEKHAQKSSLVSEIKSAKDGLKTADDLAGEGKYKEALDKLAKVEDLASAANSCDLSKPDKKAVFEELKKGGDSTKALAVAAVTNAKGTASKEDAVAVAKEAAKLPVGVLKRLNASGATVVAARGNVPDAIPSLSGVHPNNWPDHMTWDNVPGVYDPSSKQIVACTRPDGTGRAVLETNTTIIVNGQEVSHGSFSVVLHEAGHGLDFNGYHDGTAEIAAELSSKALFTGKRSKDVTDGKIKSPRDDYYLQGSPWGERETFAESTARSFGGDGTLAGRDGWPETAKFWSGKPWGIGNV